MYIAQQLRKTNITAYAVYMFQVEDVLRACNMDIDQVCRTYLVPFGYNEEKNREAREWYAALIRMMKEEGCQDKGHVQVVRATVTLLCDRHNELMQDTRRSAYHAIYYKALPHIVALRAHGENKDKNEVENCLDALYGLTLLKMKGQTLSPQTREAMGPIALLMESLSKLYNETE